MKRDIDELIELVDMDMLDVKDAEQVVELLTELKVTRKALELLSTQYSYFFHRGKDCPFDCEEWSNLSWCKEIRRDLDCSRECIRRYYLMKAGEEV